MATWNAALRARDPAAGLFLRRYSIGDLVFLEGGAPIVVGDADKAILALVENRGGELAFEISEADANGHLPSKTAFVPTQSLPADRMVYFFLEDAAGASSAVGNYSDAGDGETDFSFGPSAGQTAEIQRLMIQIRDTGAPDSGKYGNDIVLANGIRVLVVNGDGAILKDLTNGDPVLTNAEWARTCYDVIPSSYGLGDDYVSVRWTFGKAGSPIVLDGDRGEKLVVRLHDDFSGLNAHTFQAQGKLIRI